MPKKVRNYILFLEDILNSIQKIERYVKHSTFEEFCKNDMAIDAVIRNLEVIGEACKIVTILGVRPSS